MDEPFKTICYVSTDEDGYLIYKSMGPGDAPEGAAEITQEQYEAIDLEKITACRLDGDRIVFDPQRYALLRNLQDKDAIRQRRETECFPVINRGKPWYDRLTETQRAELTAWYQAWLDAPGNGVIPEAPAFLGEGGAIM